MARDVRLVVVVVRRADCTAWLYEQQTAQEKTKHSGDCHPAFLIIFRLPILRERSEKSSHLTPDVPACPFLAGLHTEGIVTLGDQCHLQGGGRNQQQTNSVRWK